MKRVMVGKVYTYQASFIDRIHPTAHVKPLQENQQVRVIQLPNAPKPGTMGQCHVEDAKSGEFLGMVALASLEKACT